MRTYTCLTLLVVLFCCDIQAQECPEKQYFDADEDLCKSLPTNFTLLFSATQYNIMIASENPLLPDTHLFDIVLYINNNTLTDTFPGDTVFFNIDHGLSFIFEGEGPSSDSSISDPAVFNTIGLSMVSSTTMDFNILYSTTVIARVVPELDIPAVSVNVSVNVTKFDSTYNCNGSECRNEGICQPVGSEFICKCTEGYLGVTCEYHVCDSCNSGNCSVDTNYTCECYPGFTDSNCSTNIDDCIAVSCGNGSCVDEVDGYSCDCNAGFAGDNCLLNIDDCDPDPCVNGTCSDLINTYTCDCYLDWEGKNCTSEIDLCKDPFGSNFPCDLIGYDKCIDGNNTFICECRSGYAGENCSIDIDECAGEPCQNNGTCEDLINSYECECKFGYDGKDCQTPIDFCLGQNESCGSGTCRSIEAIGYECDCDAGYSGDNCSIEIDECFTINPCENGATCIDQVANYSCLCPVGFTGVNCSQVIDNCDPDPCLHNSTCTSLIGSFRCDCSPDYIGARCEIEELFCNSATCLNGGTCSELDGGNGTMCSCLEGFSGNDCSDDLDFCMNASCKNGGTCLEGYGTKVYCKCPIDFGGDECEVEMIFCSENYCLNNGTCIDLDEGSSTVCICVEGFSGDMCDEDIEVCNVIPQKCFNGATCLDGYGVNYTCQCVDGFGGSDCSEDLNFCEDSFCLNGGICIEGIGAVKECNCTENFFGQRCETAFCPEEWCYNGGTCSIESNKTICSCKGECSGDRCEQDLSSPCEPDTCLNGGTCMMGICEDYICVCPSTYTGDNCETPLCQTDSCMNGGTCRVMNNELVCDCLEGFNGTSCEFDLNHCTFDECLNGGTCMEGLGVNVTCICPNCFIGNRCEVDMNYCQDFPDYCLNDGTCVDGVGCDYSCDCPDTYQGETCETAFCPDSWCFNGGTCSVESNKTVCSCESGCGGDRCETDENVCVPNPCFNGGICTEGLCSDYTCNCTSEFEGDNCEIPLCQTDSCMNGGTCRVMNNELLCDCPEGFNGTSCEFDLSHCTSDYCMNGGTCMEGLGVIVECICPTCFNGDRCEVDLNYCQDFPDYCLNDGTCVDGVGCDYSCDCPDTYQGETCETAFCPDSWCFNGGTCSVESNKTVCSCESGCGGDRCETDENVCVPNPCFNGGICTEGLCSDYTCNCTSEFEGDNCEIPLCQANSCMNGGTCRVMNNELLCDCPEGFNGTSCEFDLSHCTSDYCMNGGTCMEGLGVIVECICPTCFNGDRCEVDLNYCQDFPDYCLNDGTCVDGVGCDYSCDCPDTYQGETCKTAFCPDSWCFNGGTCSVESNKTVCSCESGCGGDRCETDEDVCVPNPCFNGGICTEGLCSDYNCNCTSEFEGDNCEIRLCQTDTCKNGGTCNFENNVLVCECQAAYSGQNCEIEIDSDCRSDSDCSSETFCNIECVSDSYTPHTALLSDAVTLKGLSFVNVEEAMHPDLSNEFSMIAVYNQEPQNRGYLIYYGTSAQKRNFGIFLDSLNSKIYLYYTNTTGHLRSYTIEQVELAGGYDHFLAVLFKNNLINVYLNGTRIGIQTLSNADFTHGVTASSPAKLFLGARYPRHYRFVGTIKQVIFFSTLQSQASIKQMQDDFYSLVDPFGNCVPYKQLDSSCPGPIEAPSTLCTSSKDRCSPSLRCLPNIIGNYTCQLQPPTCSSDLDCSGDYFCGSELPFNGSNYFDNSATEIPGETVFLQDSSMEFDGEDVVTLPTSDSPDLQSDITIFAVVYQESGNDGYVVGKGINGNMRDFGLYLRSSRKTVWLVYGADSHGLGYKEIVFFHNVSVADGNTHSIAAVVDSTANRTLLYIDGEVIGQQSPLPSEPTFRPGHNLLYVGGRPSTRYFRFKGTIRNLFVSSAPLQKDTIVKLHNDAMSGDQRISLQLPTSRYCLPYRKHTESCILGEESSDFRCLAPAVCIPECSSSVTRNIPSTNSAFQQTGVCVEPCTCDDETNEECGMDGSTYKNSCFRECLKVTKLHDGKCLII